MFSWPVRGNVAPKFLCDKKNLKKILVLPKNFLLDLSSEGAKNLVFFPYEGYMSNQFCGARQVGECDLEVGKFN